MATQPSGVDLSVIRDPQRPISFAVGLLLIVVGFVGLTGLIDTDVGLGPGLVFGLFGVPFWLGVTAIVAGLLAIVLSMYAGAGTTFNKLAGGLVLPIVILLTLADWAFAGGGLVSAGIGFVALLVAVALVGVGFLVLHRHPVGLVLPVVAVVTLADWLFGLTAMVPAARANLPTVALLVVLSVAIAFIGFEGGARRT